jgi:hypothetical protein
MSFVAPTWDSSNCQYIIELLPAYSDKTRTFIKKDANGSTVFADADFVENITDAVVHNLIEEGSSNNWFTKLPSHEQLMKRVKHVFKTLAQESQNAAVVTSLLLTPKQISFVWDPIVFTNSVLPFSFDDSDSDSDSAGEEVDLPESNLPPVKLTDDSQQSHEEYLLTRLRAAKARVEAEQIRMQYFEATGRMPPDSESEDE